MRGKALSCLERWNEAESELGKAIALLQGLVDAGTAEPDDLKQLDAYRRGVPYYLGGE